MSAQPAQPAQPAIFPADAHVNVMSNGRSYPAYVVSFDAASSTYTVRLRKSGAIWSAHGMWVTAARW